MIDEKEMHQFSEAHYQVAMEAAGLGMWDWDLRLNRLFWSKECKTILGLPPDAPENFEYYLSRIHPEDRERIVSIFSANYSTHTPHNVVYRVIRPDGSIHWIADRGQFIFDEQGQPIRVSGVAWDITAQKQAEEAQQQSDKHVREILESIGEAFLHLDQAWCFTYANVQAVKTGGHRCLGDLLGQNFWAQYPFLIGTETEHYYRQVMETRQPVVFEAFYPQNQRWYDIRVYPAEQGGITSFYMDITERKSLEQERDQLLLKEREALRETEKAHQQSNELIQQLEHKQAFLQTIMQQAPSGMVIVDAPKGKIISYNEEAVKMLGYPDMENESYADYARYGALHVDGTPYNAEEYPLARTILTGEVIKQEDMLYRRNDSCLVHLSTNAAPIYNAQGKILAGIITFHDISERYELEQKKDEFIRLASHELRTPLTSLKGNLQLTERYLKKHLKHVTGLSEQEEIALLEQLTGWNERALRQTNVENRLINDLLDASYIQAKGLRISVEAGNVVQIVRDAVDDMQTVAQPNTLYFEAPDFTEVPVMVDRVRIGQVVTNYVRNALKYATEQQPVLVGMMLEDHEARVWVKDTGPGLSLEQQCSIWERFHQTASLTGYSYAGCGGLGLDLYICQELIQLHGGRSGVESTLGQGATFWFILPTLSRR